MITAQQTILGLAKFPNNQDPNNKPYWEGCHYHIITETTPEGETKEHVYPIFPIYGNQNQGNSGPYIIVNFAEGEGEDNDSKIGSFNVNSFLRKNAQPGSKDPADYSFNLQGSMKLYEGKIFAPMKGWVGIRKTDEQEVKAVRLELDTDYLEYMTTEDYHKKLAANNKEMPAFNLEAEALTFKLEDLEESKKQHIEYMDFYERYIKSQQNQTKKVKSKRITPTTAQSTTPQPEPQPAPQPGPQPAV